MRWKWAFYLFKSAGIVLGLYLGSAGLALGQGEINLTAATYAQDFDSLGTNDVATLPAGFKLTPSNILSTQRAVWTNTSNYVTTVYAAAGGTPTTGGRYNWGATGGSDRAAGFMTGTGAVTRYLGNNGILAGFTNNTGNTITQMLAGFVLEQYRIHTEATTNFCYFSKDGLSSGWGTPLYSNVFSGAASAYGYPLATASVHVAKGGLSISNGGKFYLLFYFTQPGVKGEGWALDDLAVAVQFKPAVALADNGTQIPAGEVALGTSNQVLHSSRLEVAAADAVLTGISFDTTGTYSAGDVTALKLYYSTDSALDPADDVLLGTLTSGLGPGLHSLSSMAQTLPAGAAGFLFITADIAATATIGDTLTVSPGIGASSLVFQSADQTGATTAGGVQTIGGCSPEGVAYTQQTGFYSWFKDGGDCFNNGETEVYMTADGAHHRVAGWRKFRTAGAGGGFLRDLQPGDRFRITLSGDSRYGVLGCALTEGAGTNSWADRTNQARMYVECSNSPDWECSNDPIGSGICTNLPGDLIVHSAAGETGWEGVNPLNTNLTLEFYILSSREVAVSIRGREVRHELPLLGDPDDDAHLDGYSLYCENTGDGTQSASVSWMTETTVTNLGFVEVGADGESRTIQGRITDGTWSRCPQLASPNRLVKSGAGTIILANTNNSYSLETDIDSGVLQISADTCLGVPPGAGAPAWIRLQAGATLAAGGTFTLNANRGLEIAGSPATLAVAEGAAVTFGGAISGTGAVAKTGTGTWVMAGTNAYAGPVSIQAGIWEAAGAMSNAPVAVAPGAELTGHGVLGALTLSGEVAPGVGPGDVATLHCQDLTLLDGGSMQVDLVQAGGTAGAGWDLLAMAGTLTAHSNGMFTVRVRGTPADFDATRGYRWTLVSGAAELTGFSPSLWAVDTNEFLAATDGGMFRVAASGSELVLEYMPRVPSAPEFSATAAGPDAITLTFSPAGADDPIVIVAVTNGIFGTPSGNAPGAGQPFADGLVVYNGRESPQVHIGLAPCSHHEYSAWAYNGTNYSPAATGSAITEPPAVPAGPWVAPTNPTEFTAHWESVPGASGYRLDVGPVPDFGEGGGSGFVAGYSNRWVADTSLGVTGLVPETTYYLRIRAEGADGCSSGNSPTSAANTPILVQDQAIDFPMIPDQVATNALILSATASSGLPVDFAVGAGPGSLAAGRQLTFTTAGAVSIVASQGGSDHWHPAPEVTNIIQVAKAGAGVSLDHLVAIYDGAPKSATVTTEPAGLAVEVTYDGSATAPSAMGSYAVMAMIVEPRYAGVATGMLVISEATLTNRFEAWLEQTRGLDPADSRYAPEADDDHDGMSTWNEFLADTDPASSGSVLRLTGTYNSVSHQMRLSFPASTGRYYQLLYSTNLGQGNSLSNVGWGTPGMSITNYMSNSWYGGIRSCLTNPVVP